MTSPTVRDLVLWHHRATGSLALAARLGGVSRATAGAIVQGADDKRWRGLDAVVAEMHARGVSARVIGMAVGKSAGAVRARVHHLGVVRESVPTRGAGVRDLVVHSHGLAGYAAGCRCGVCGGAVRGQKARLAAATAGGVRGGAPWSAEDDLVVLDPGLSLTEIALMLGRSYRAVSSRRARLRRV